ncbi:MAT1-1-1 [Lentithecium fluviatile CBS 122367]|uniref:Mating-type protein MAT-1 n=1 Tax=Lentithecium fluviatile CBS 122367 TaxID=1168545 RepID=A0A6G1JMX9_9PLEO|nr:MAT1-1-1 [Lentithecium fluviatile CBS 122367]
MSSFQPQTLDSTTRNPTSPEIGDFLSTRTGREMVELLQSMRDPTAQAALTTALLFSPPVASNPVATAKKAKKALNAFVGFRCYYIIIPPFKPWPMKTLSGPMGTLWDSDPNKAYWSLMAKAWSTIRDQVGKDNAPLDHFFRIVCPYLNIPSPETYLQHLGWNFHVNRDGLPTISRDPSYNMSPSDARDETVALSVEDIISYCQSMGYAQQYVFDHNTTSSTFLGHTSSMTSSFAATKQATKSAEARRLAEKKKRRAKRQMARETGLAAKFQEQVVYAHGLDGREVPQDSNEVYLQGSQRDTASDCFYDGLSGILTNHLATTDDNTADHFQVIATNGIEFDSNMNYGPFRVGADENATLPPFTRGNV